MSTRFNSKKDRLLLITLTGQLNRIRSTFINSSKVTPFDAAKVLETLDAANLTEVYSILKATTLQIESKTEVHTFLHYLKK